MQNKENQRNIRAIIEWAIIVILFSISIILQFLPIRYAKNAFIHDKLTKIIPQMCGAIAGLMLLIRLKFRLFQKPENALYLLPCLLVAINNFQFSAYFHGEMEIVYTKPFAFILFALECIFVGLLEECIFRGVLFALLMQYLPKNKKGFLGVYFISSVSFGLAHLLNGFGAILQVGYSILTGGLFAFCLMKTKNILCPAFIHALFNFCGMLFDKQGLGNGVVFDVGTIISMLVVGLAVGIFVLYKVLTYPEIERCALYKKFSIKE